MSESLSRRSFLKRSSEAAVGLAAAGSALAASSPSDSPQLGSADTGAPSSRSVSANEKIVVGFIGVAGRGNAHLDSFPRYPDVEVGAICDVYEPHLNAALQKGGGKARRYSDFRKLLEQKDLDAVVIATPPHWHPLITIAACEAGKDVYVEKPMSLYPAEIPPMLRAARENKRMTQVGTQIHATDNYRRVVEIVRSGVLGKITAVRNILFLNEAPQGIGRPANTPPPPGLDWEMWLGPAPYVPFNVARFENGQHRYFKDLVGSWLHEMGPHIVDLPVWALELGPPKSAAAGGGRFAMDDISDIPDTLDVTWEYPGLIMTWHHSAANSYPFHWGDKSPFGRRIAVLFQGTNGSLVADYDRHEIIAEGDRMKDAKLPEPSIPSSPGHDREFLDSVRSRKPPSCNLEYHQNVHLALNLGQLSYRVGRKVYWDAAAGRIAGDREADVARAPRYRKPWSLPA